MKKTKDFTVINPALELITPQNEEITENMDKDKTIEELKKKIEKLEQKNEKKTKRMNIVLTKREKERLENASYVTRRSMNEIIEEALDFYLTEINL